MTLDAKRIADRYIGPKGGMPKKTRTKRGRHKASTSRDDFTLPLSDYKLLREAAEASSDFNICESCGAWLLGFEDGVHLGEVVSCEYYAYGDERFRHTCRRYRASIA